MIEVIKTPEISLNECSLCDTILVTYTLVGEEPVTVEVTSSGEMGGLNTYDIDLGEFGIRLLYYSLTQWVLDGSSNVYLESELECPFGVYITAGGDPDIFEAFEVEPIL